MMLDHQDWLHFDQHSKSSDVHSSYYTSDTLDHSEQIQWLANGVAQLNSIYWLINPHLMVSGH